MKNLFIPVILAVVSLTCLSQNEIFKISNESIVKHEIAISSNLARYDVFEIHDDELFYLKIRKTESQQTVEKSIYFEHSMDLVSLNKSLTDSEGSLYILYKHDGYNIRLMKLSSNLEIQWDKLIVASSETLGNYYFDNLTTWGTDHVLISISEYERHRLILIHKNGNIIWKNSYSEPDNEKCPGFDAICIEDGAIASMKSGSNAVIYRIDLNGDVVWSRSIDDSVYRHAKKLVVKNDKIYVFGTENDAWAFLIVMDMNGNVLESKSYHFNFHFVIGFYHHNNNFYFEVRSYEDFTFLTTKIIKLDDQFNFSETYIIDISDNSMNLKNLDLEKTGGFIPCTYNGYSVAIQVTDIHFNTCFDDDYENIAEIASNNILVNTADLPWGVVVKTSTQTNIDYSVNHQVSASNSLEVVTGCASELLNNEELTSSFGFYPNPAQDVLNLIYAESVAQLTILDLTGKTIQIIEKPLDTVQLDALISGNYVMKIVFKSGEVKHEKLVISK